MLFGATKPVFGATKTFSGATKTLSGATKISLTRVQRAREKNYNIYCFAPTLCGASILGITAPIPKPSLTSEGSNEVFSFCFKNIFFC